MKRQHHRIDYEKFFIARFQEEWAILNLVNYKSYCLNRTASLVFDLLEKGKDVDEISSYISKKFRIAYPKTKNEVKKLCGDFKRKGILVT